jgi:dephospho-CoA kinase
MIIGLTGKNAAGKGEIANYLKTKGFVYYSLSDVIREEATERGLEHSRDNLIRLGTELREKHGHAILAERINYKIRKLQNQDVVVDSIRNPGEIEELRKNKGFILIAIHTDPKIRFQRLLKRGRAGDSKTLQEFMEHENKENNDKGAGQQLDKCIEMADAMITSNGTIEEANKDLEAYLSTLKDKAK